MGALIFIERLAGAETDVTSTCDALMLAILSGNYANLQSLCIYPYHMHE